MCNVSVSKPDPYIPHQPKEKGENKWKEVNKVTNDFCSSLYLHHSGRPSLLICLFQVPGGFSAFIVQPQTKHPSATPLMLIKV